MARRKKQEEEYEEEYEDEYEEEYEGDSLADRFSQASWRRALLVPLILVLFGFGTWFAWKKYKDEVLNHPSYALDPTAIQYTPPPEWLKRDILKEVVELGSLESRKIHETDLTVHVRNAFVHHPWIREVERIRIFHPANLEAVLVYRDPVAMVALPDYDPDDGEAWILPIDSEATLLPAEDFTPEFAQKFPRIDVGNTVPSGPVGSAWGDEMVADAAKIAELLYKDWEQLRDVLYQVERSSLDTSTSNAADFDIRSRPGKDGVGLIVRWGRAPGKEQVGEPTATAKLAELKKWVSDAKLTGQIPRVPIDLRSVKDLQASKRSSVGGTFIR